MARFWGKSLTALARVSVKTISFSVPFYEAPDPPSGLGRHGGASPARQWRTECEQKKFRSYRAPRGRVSSTYNVGLTGHVPVKLTFLTLGQILKSDIKTQYPLNLSRFISDRPGECNTQGAGML
jgi:hypothetical protein